MLARWKLSIPVFPSVSVCDWSDHSARIARGDTVCRNVLCHNTAAADYHVVSDRNARHYLRACADPYVIADYNRSSIFQALISPFMIDRMPRSMETARRRKKDVVSECHTACIKNDQAVVCIEVFTHFDSVTVITPEIRLDMNMLPAFS